MRETIICYDICCPRRLGRIHRYLKRVAYPLQYSVFMFTGTAVQLERCLARLNSWTPAKTTSAPTRCQSGATVCALVKPRFLKASIGVVCHSRGMEPQALGTMRRRTAQQA